MRSKGILVGALAVAFLIGLVAEGYIKPALASVSQERTTLTAPAPRSSYQAPAAYREEPAPAPVAAHHRRSTDREILIVAGSSGAGAAIGALAGGKKGAGIGAVSGGVAGLVYDLATRNK